MIEKPELRALWGPLVGRLTRAAGLADPALAEDAAQAAMLQAMRTWPVAGAPESPAAWLTTVAQRRLIDLLRARARETSLDALAEDAPEKAAALATTEPTEPVASGEIDDNELALLFACCDPRLPLASQIAFALKTVCGFSLREIAAALLSDESALAQRLARARATLAAGGRAIVLPAGPELAARRDSALTAIYLLFNEGYAAHMPNAGHGGAMPSPQRPDLCREAIRLARALAAHPHSAHADADALAALLLLHGARLPARVNHAGDWLLLADQPRALWDRRMIALGLKHLERARRATTLSHWHLHAGIASEHATAASFANTRWLDILAAYETLRTLDPSPMVELALGISAVYAGQIARGEAHIQAALGALPPALAHFGHAALGDARERSGDAAGAAACFARAAALAQSPADRRVLRARRAALSTPPTDA
jgi:RNA polymerase sigma-70 factor (ECF subfamily)